MSEVNLCTNHESDVVCLYVEDEASIFLQNALPFRKVFSIQKRVPEVERRVTRSLAVLPTRTRIMLLSPVKEYAAHQCS